MQQKKIPIGVRPEDFKSSIILDMSKVDIINILDEQAVLELEPSLLESGGVKANMWSRERANSVFAIRLNQTLANWHSRNTSLVSGNTL